MSQMHARLKEVLSGEHPGSAEHGAASVTPVYACVEAWMPTDRDRPRGCIRSDACS